MFVLYMVSSPFRVVANSVMQEEQRQSDEGRKMGGPREQDIAVSKVLEKKAKEKNTIITSIACVASISFSLINVSSH